MPCTVHACHYLPIKGWFVGEECVWEMKMVGSEAKEKIDEEISYEFFFYFLLCFYIFMFGWHENYNEIRILGKGKLMKTKIICVFWKKKTKFDEKSYRKITWYFVICLQNRIIYFKICIG